MQKLDTTIMNKFDELAEKGKLVSASQQVTDIASVVDSGKFQEWATASLSLLQRVFGEKSPFYLTFRGIHSKIINIAYQESFDNCRAILQSAREEYQGGGLCDLRLFLDYAVLEYLAASTADFLRRGEKETACILAAVLLENALRHLCARKGVAPGPPEQMNDALYKAGAYLVGTQQRIKDWSCMKEDFIQGYGEKYRAAEVDDMLRGVMRFIGKELAS